MQVTTLVEYLHVFLIIYCLFVQTRCCSYNDDVVCAKWSFVIQKSWHRSHKVDVVRTNSTLFVQSRLVRTNSSLFVQRDDVVYAKWSFFVHKVDIVRTSQRRSYKLDIVRPKPTLFVQTRHCSFKLTTLFVLSSSLYKKLALFVRSQRCSNKVLNKERGKLQANFDTETASYWLA